MSKARPEERFDEQSDEKGWREEQTDTQLQVDLFKVRVDEDATYEDEDEILRTSGPVWNYQAPEEVKEPVKATFAAKHSKGAKILKQDFPTLAQSVDMTPQKKSEIRQKPQPDKPTSTNVYDALSDNDEEAKAKPEKKPNQKKTKKTKWKAVEINAKIAFTEAAKEQETIYTAPEIEFDKSAKKYPDGDRRQKRQIGFGSSEGLIRRSTTDNDSEAAIRRSPESGPQSTFFRRNPDLITQTSPPSGDFKLDSGDSTIRRSTTMQSEAPQKEFVRREDFVRQDASQPTKSFVRRELQEPTKTFVRKEQQQQPEEPKPAEPRKRFTNTKKLADNQEDKKDGPLKDSWTGVAKPVKPRENAWTTNRLSFENKP